MKRTRDELFDKEANIFFNKYYDLTGREFPAFDHTEWSSLEEWLVDMKLAVYREQAVQEIEGKDHYCKAIVLVPAAGG